MAFPDSPRDHEADAHPDLSRKRPRLSEENDSPSASTEPLQIEALDLEEAGSSFVDAIEIEDDNMPPSYSDDFEIERTAPSSPIEQIKHFRKECLSDHYVEPGHLYQTQTWLDQHLEGTALDGSDVWLHGYAQDDVFFGLLGQACSGLLNRRDDAFDEILTAIDPMFKDRLHHFLRQLQVLSTRFVQLLPDITADKLSRRDSAQLRSGHHRINALHYLHVLRALLAVPTQAPMLQNLRTSFSINVDSLIQGGHSHFLSREGTMKCLVIILGNLARNAREVYEAWPYMDSILTLIRSFIIHSGQVGDELDEMVEIVNRLILPAIREKHPRALPSEFHAHVVEITSLALRTRALLLDFPLVCRLYVTLVRNDGDALVVKPRDREADLEDLWTKCHRDKQLLADHISTAWILQTEKSFLLSEVIDVRNCGIRLLSNHLTRAFQKFAGHAHHQHPLLQYNSRFLRVNDLTRYIFSAESHASLVSQSADIVGFLVVTQSYTDQETDVLWEATTNSAEVEFAKASCAVLRVVCGYMDKEQLLYVVQRYSNTPVSRMGLDVINLLPFLFGKIEEKVSAGDALQKDRLATAFVCLDLLRHLPSDTLMPLVNLLRTMAIAELTKYANFAADDRFAIYQSCFSDLVDRTEFATTSAEVLQLFLQKSITSAEVEKLLRGLPLKAVVDEFSTFTRQVATSDQPKVHSALMTRLEVIMILMGLTPGDPDQVIGDLLFDFLLGHSSLDMYAREEAWKRLKNATLSLHSAQRLLDRYLSEFVPILDAKFATPYLIQLILDPLKGQVRKTALEGTLQVLDHPLWKALVRFASDSNETTVNEAAQKALCDLLFVYPQKLEAKSTIVECQAAFVRHLVDRLCIQFPDVKASLGEEPTNQQFQRAVHLLRTLLHASRVTQACFSSPATPDTLHIGMASSADPLCFQVQIHSSERQADRIEAKASQSATLAQLSAAMQEHTGVSEHRVIVGGKSIDLVTNADSTLSAAGIQASSVIMMSPRYTFTCDLNVVFKRPGPVEQAITEQYDRLEHFVNGPQAGPTSVANTANEFLKTLRPSNAARQHVVSADTQRQYIFSADQPFRSSHSLHVLDCQLKDFASLGVADEDFILRTVRRLTAFLMEPNVAPDLQIDTFIGLKSFLCELPSSVSDVPCFEDSAAFVAWIVDVLSVSARLASSHTQGLVQGVLLKYAYLALLEAFRKDSDVWKCFTHNGKIAALHAQLLVHDDTELATQVAGFIDDFCKEATSPTDAPLSYWKLVKAAIPQALKCEASTASFFTLALRLLHLNTDRQTSESDTRSLIQTLVSSLWLYTHNESPELPVPDEAVTGLLKLIHGAMMILRSSKKPLNQPQLAVDIFNRLLFPAGDKPKEGSILRPLICDEAREVAFELIKLTCETPECHEALSNLVGSTLSVLTADTVKAYPGADDWLRAPERCSGLTNLGMTCYMNSLLQQLFANLQFRKFVLDLAIVNEEQQVLLAHVQRLFANMQDSSNPCAETAPLAKVLGVQTDSQEDVHGFFATLFSRLEENMPDTNAKRQLSKFFTGNFITQIKGACGHVSTQTEPFLDVSITVKNKASLQESLNEFVQGEPMQGANKYRCLTCNSEGGEGRLVDAMKRTCLDDVPDNLVFCLKRFTFEAMMGLEGKANDRFDFPAEIDMAVYQRSHLEQLDVPLTPDMFELVGVIVHQGSLEFGHYWSYVRIGGSMDSSTWVLAEDRSARPVHKGIVEVQAQCSGGLLFPNGNERAENAYVLLYQRASRFRERAQVVKRIPGDERYAHLLPPRVSVPAKMKLAVSTANDQQHRVAHLFNLHFASFVTWILDSCVIHLSATTERSDNEDEWQHLKLGPTVASIAKVAATYFLYVVLRDPSGEKRLRSFASALNTTSASFPFVTRPFLKELTTDEAAFHWIWRVENRACRRDASALVLGSLRMINDDDVYDSCMRELVAAHSSFLGLQLEFLYSHWSEYFEFIILLAESGPFETVVAHDSGYIEWAMGILLFEIQPEDVRSRRRHIAKAIANRKLDMSSLFGLMCGLLNEHVDMSTAHLLTPADPPTIAESGLVHMQPAHWDLVLCEALSRPRSCLGLLWAASKHCELTRSWKMFSPGKFFHQLVSDTSDLALFRKIEESLLVRLDDETDRLESLLYIVLHVCMARNDRDMIPLFKMAAKNFLVWDNVEAEALEFWVQSHELAPLATLEAIPCWAPDYLLRPRKPKVRQRTAAYLRQILFEAALLNADASDLYRVRTARTLVGKLIPALQQAYGEETPRRHCEEVISVLQWAGEYLGNLLKRVKDISEDDEAQVKDHYLSHALLLECDESRSALVDIDRLLDELAGWVTEPANLGVSTLRDLKRAADASAVSERDYGDLAASDEELDDQEYSSFVSDESGDPEL